MADEADSQAKPQAPCRLLRRPDQQFLAAMLLLAGLGLLGSWWPSGGNSGPLPAWGASNTCTARFEVDINSAPWPELTQLPEIGETLARRIVENRNSEGPFHCPEDLIRVRGIGKKKLAQIRPYLSPESWRPQPTESLPAPGEVPNGVHVSASESPSKSHKPEPVKGVGVDLPKIAPLPDDSDWAYNDLFQLDPCPPNGCQARIRDH